MGGVRYDDSVYYVTVSVTDQGNDGQMDAVVTNLTKGTKNDTGSSAQEIAFVNDYEPAAVTVTLNGTKVLEGKELTEGEFTFCVSDADGNLVSSGRNAVSYTHLDVYKRQLQTIITTATPLVRQPMSTPSGLAPTCRPMAWWRWQILC